MEFTGEVRHIDVEMKREMVEGEVEYIPLLKVTISIEYDDIAMGLIPELGQWREWGNKIAFALTNTEPDVPGVE